MCSSDLFSGNGSTLTRTVAIAVAVDSKERSLGITSTSQHKWNQMLWNGNKNTLNRPEIVDSSNNRNRSNQSSKKGLGDYPLVGSHGVDRFKVCAPSRHFPATVKIISNLSIQERMSDNH